jgi:GAF domain-containing protein/DNA-binding CsgD family transcriptional regulator
MSIQKIRKKMQELENAIVSLRESENIIMVESSSTGANQDELNKRNKSLEAINRIAHILYTSLDFDTLVKRAVSSMMDYSRSLGIAFFILQENKHYLEMIHSLGFKAGARRKASILPLDGSLSGHTVAGKKIIFCRDIKQDSRIEPAVKDELLKEGRKSIISVPLLYNKQVMGVINLIFKEKPSLSKHEEEALLSIGKTIGLAIMNVRYIEQIKKDIEFRKKAEKDLQMREQDLQIKTRNLEEANIALNVLLIKRENDKKELEEKILLNVRDNIIPLIERMKTSRCTADQNVILALLEKNLNEIVSPFLQQLTFRYSNLTQKQIQIIQFIREGKSSKEIGSLMNLTPRAVDYHRAIIRQKIGLKNKGATLQSFFLTQ